MNIEDRPSVYFVIIEGGTIQGKSLLVASDGHTYYQRNEVLHSQVWRCSRSKSKKGLYMHRNIISDSGMKCNVNLHQIGDRFFSDWKEHNHPAKPGILGHILFQHELKNLALTNDFMTFPSALEKLKVNIADLTNKDDINGITITGISRYRDYKSVRNSFHKYRKRPSEPSTVDFKVDVNYISNNTIESFFRIDLDRKGSRHLFFASEKQLKLASKSKFWLINTTLNVINNLFSLLTVFSYGRIDGEVELVPLVFILMTNKKRKDYKEVFRALLGLLPENPIVKDIVVCCDVSLLRGVQLVCSEATIRICPFSLWQELQLKIRETKVRAGFGKKQIIHRIIRKLSALPLLPSDQMANVFEEINKEASSFPRLKSVLEYVRNSWMENPRCSLSSLSAFGFAVSNKDETKEWQDTLLSKFKHHSKKFYFLVLQLYKEATKIPSSCKMVSLGKVKRRQNTISGVQVKLENIWNSYLAGKIDIWEMLKKCSRINCHGYQR